MLKEDLKLFVHIPRLQTDRLLLRRIKSSDVEDIYEYASDPLVPKFLLWYPHPDRRYTKYYFNHINTKYRNAEFYDWGVVFDGKMIGTCGFSHLDVENNSGEIGFVLNRKYWGLGIATEAAQRVIKFGFEELDLRRIYIRYMTENTASRHVAEKCRMRFEGVQKDGVQCKGGYRDVGICAITKPEYLSLLEKGEF